MYNNSSIFAQNFQNKQCLINIRCVFEVDIEDCDRIAFLRWKCTPEMNELELPGDRNRLSNALSFGNRAKHFLTLNPFNQNIPVDWQYKNVSSYSSS